MKEEFVQYLGLIGMGDALIERVSALERSIAAILPEEITHIFVSEYIDKEDNRQFENLYFFTGGYLVETRNFVTEPRTEVDLIRQSIINVQLTLKDYDLRSASQASRFTFGYSTGPLSAQLRASKENCDHLLRVVRECIIPNFAESTPPPALTGR